MKQIYDRASRFVLSSRVKAFDLGDEPDKLAMLTAAARSARATCWPAGWWSKA